MNTTELKNKFMELPPQQRTLAFAAGYMLLIGIYGTALIKPQHQRYSEIENQLATAANTLKQQEQQVSELPQLRKNIKTIEQLLPTVEEAIPSRANFAALRNELTSIAQGNNTTIQQISFTPTGGTKGVSAFVLQVDVSGAAPDVMKTLAAFENIKRFTQSGEINVQSESEGIRGSMNFNVFIRNPLSPDPASAETGGSSSSGES